MIENGSSRDHAPPTGAALDWRFVHREAAEAVRQFMAPIVMLRRLAGFLRGKKRDPLAELRRALTDDEYVALRLEKFELDRLDALREGSATLHDLTNCAHGTWGHAIRTLERDGLMVCDRHERDAHNYMLWHYSITPKGRAYLGQAEHA